MNNADKKPRAPFGEVLGVAPGAVEVRSCHYPSADPALWKQRANYESRVDGVFMGVKWQCVELARRWMHAHTGCVFDDVPMAYDIFRLRSVRRVADDARLPLCAFRNGSRRWPEVGSLLIWNEGGEFETTGHVAVVVEVHADRVCLIEQNVDDAVWPEGQPYSRALEVRVSDEGEYWLQCLYPDVSILGWVTQTEDDAHAEPLDDPDPRLLRLVLREAPGRPDAPASWLDLSRPEEVAYDAMMGSRLMQDPARQLQYLCLSREANRLLERATNELHALFMFATNAVLRDDALLARFNIPRVLWARLHQSWENRRNLMITGRFDFALTERGLKAYEYNADSASCYLETARLQGRWAAHVGCEDGDDPGRRLHARLVEAWRHSGVEGRLHIMQDHDLEETYHALTMKSAAEAAGIPCTVIKGLAGLAWDDDGDVIDPNGVKLRFVWKTWAWETALEQIRAECDADEQRLLIQAGGVVGRASSPRLVDVLLRPDIQVFEPFWTLIPSNKAILPVLWTMFPKHPFLLESKFDLDPALRERGYVAKPIAGRCGLNVSIVDRHDNVIEDTAGRFAHQDQIYQALSRLPCIDGLNVQICTFSVGGSHAGACARVDPAMIITSQSDLMPLRVVDDDALLPPDAS